MWHQAKIYLFHNMLNIELKFTKIPVRCYFLKQENLIGRAVRETLRKRITSVQLHVYFIDLKEIHFRKVFTMCIHIS